MRASDYSYFDAPFCAFAHRGGPLLPANLGRENSLHAFRQAVALGYRYLETDVHATADGVLIAFHDDRLDRVTDGSGVVAELPWAEVRRARIGGTEPIPTLDEVFESLPDTRFNIDIKASGAVLPLVDTIVAHRAQQRVCVTSFGQDRLAEFRRRMGNHVATGMGPREVARTRFVPLLPRLLPSTGVVLQVPVTTRIAGRRVRIVTRDLVRLAHATGRQVHVWTIDDPDQMHELLDLGVDGLISDRIDVLREVLVNRNLWWGD